MLRLWGCITEQHDLRRVALAACISVIACFTTANLLARCQTRRIRGCWAWLVAAALVFGGGVGSLPFVAMLAFMPGPPVTYQLGTTIWSVVAAVAGAFVAFTAWRLIRQPWLGAMLSGVLLSIAVGVMHYCGVAAMQIAGGLRLEAEGVVTSVLLSLGCSVMALAPADCLKDSGPVSG